MRILTISDLHAPFAHPAALDFLSDLRRSIKPDAVVCLGDEIDAHGWSRHGREADAPGQADEVDAARGYLRRVFKLFPAAYCCRSNHGERSFKAATRIGLPSAFLRDLHEVYGAPAAWKWVHAVELDGIRFIHGEGFSGQNAALRAAQVNRCSVVMGHIHAWAGIQYHCNGDSLIFGMNAGCLIDPAAVAMRYARTCPNKPTLGTGCVIDGVPHFYPLGA